MNKSEANVFLDCKGLNCPMPVVKIKKALDSLESGQVLLVEVTDKGAKADIPAMLKRTNSELLGMEEKDNVFTFLIFKKTK
ncbi:MAG: sulfurtransferase TusA family protein [Nitrospirae bacterium]|nr:sulfurtransferase TusA family protein [Nitrospirota bacterium]